MRKWTCLFHCAAVYAVVGLMILFPNIDFTVALVVVGAVAVADKTSQFLGRKAAVENTVIMSLQDEVRESQEVAKKALNRVDDVVRRKGGRA